MNVTGYIFAALLFTGAASAKESDDPSAAGNKPSPTVDAHDAQSKAKAKESRRQTIKLTRARSPLKSNAIRPSRRTSMVI